MADIKNIKIGGTTYEIWAPKSDASGLQGDIVWTNASALQAAVSTDSTTGFALAKDVASAINQQIGGVYKVKGTLTATVTDGAISNMPSNAANGDVYNIKLPDGTASATLDGQTIFDGDNVVFVKPETGAGSWDKLAGTVDLSNYATTAWTNEAISSYVNTATSAEAPTLWNNVTALVEEKTSDLTTSSTKWNETYEVVTAGSANWNSTYTAVTATSSNWDTAYSEITGAVKTSADMELAANKAKIAQVGAITGYIEDKIAETVAETIDIASTIDDTTKTSAIPNVGAVSSFVDSKIGGLTGDYIEKKDIYYSAVDGIGTLVIDNT